MKTKYTNTFFRKVASDLSIKIAEAHDLFDKVHLLSLGYICEELLRVFLKELLNNTGLIVTQGFIQKEKHLSKQCDIIIYNPKQDTIKYHMGELSVVSANSVKAVIEVKSSIKIKTWDTTLKGIRILNDFGIHNFFIFVCGAFSIKKLQTFLFKPVSSDEITFGGFSKYDHGDEHYLPQCICSIGSNTTYTLDYIDNGRDNIGYISVQAIDSKNQSIASLHEFIYNIYSSITESNKMVYFPKIKYFKKVTGIILYET